MAMFTWNPQQGQPSYWDAAQNWLPAKVPGAADTAIIPEDASSPAYITYLYPVFAAQEQVAGLIIGGKLFGGTTPYIKLIMQPGTGLSVGAGGITPQSPADIAEIDMQGAVLSLAAGSVAGSSVLVDFIGGGNVLDLQNVGDTQANPSLAPDAFDGVIDGFNRSNTIALGVAYDPHDTVQYAAGSGGGTLTVTGLMGTVAVLHLSGLYNAGNFSLVSTDVYPPSGPAFNVEGISFVEETIQGPAGGRATINGTSGDDTIIAYGGSNTIIGNGGSDTITTGAGGYNRVIQGTSGDGAFGTTTINLNGPGNAVVGDDENYDVYGGTGFTSITLGDGDENISLGGTYNTITVGRGTNVIEAGGAYSRVFISGGFQGPTPNDTVIFSGQHNQLVVNVNDDQFIAGGTITLSGGTGYGNYSLDGLGGLITTDGLYNTISFFQAHGVIRPGSGYDTVNLGDPDAAVFYGPGPVNVYLSGTHNTVYGEGDPAVVSGGSGNSQFSFNYESNAGLLIGAPVTGHSYTVETGGSYNKFSLIDVNSNTIVAGSDHATVSILDPTLYYDPGQPLNPVVYAGSSITFAGTGNSLTVQNGTLMATGGSGGSTYSLGDSNAAVTTGGSYNQITAGAGTDTISPGSDHDTVALNGTNAAVSLQGAADKVFLNAGASGSISGTGLADLHVYVMPDIGHEIINSILTDPRAVITLTGGAGGYTTGAQAAAALTSDGAGGSLLAIGSGSLDFTGAAPATLHAGMFVIA